VKITEIRLNLEGFAAASAATRATTRATPAEREGLRALRDEIMRLTEDTPRATLIRLDQDVHRAIYDAAAWTSRSAESPGRRTGYAPWPACQMAACPRQNCLPVPASRPRTRLSC
jgi:hypothetical protein